MGRQGVYSGWTHAGNRRVWVRVPERLKQIDNGDGGPHARAALDTDPLALSEPYWRRPFNGNSDQAPDGTPIVLVHGIGFSSRAMEPLLRAFGETRAVFAPDLPGFGLSDAPPRPLDVPGLADALRRWMIDNRIAPGVLVAASFGCQVAIDLAARHPEMVERLILVGPTADPSRRNRRSAALHWAANAAGSSPRLAPRIAMDVLDAGPWRAARTLRHAFADPVEEKLPRIKAPTLVVRGSRDRVVSPDWAEAVARRIPHSELVTLRGCAHVPGPRAAERLAPVVAQFLESEIEASPPEPDADAEAAPEEAEVPAGIRRWIVDGMNVIGSHPDGWWRDRPGAWDRLARELDSFSRERGEAVQLVLDGRRPSGWPEESRLIETAFAGKGRDAADDAIVAKVAADPRPELVCVVSSDRELTARVREIGARTMPARGFRALLESAD